MRNLQGKAFNLATISKFFSSLSNLSQPLESNVSAFPLLMRSRLLSTLGGKPGRGHFKSSNFDRFDDHSGDDDDKLYGENRRNLSTHQRKSSPSRPLRGERKNQNFRGKRRDFDEQCSGGRNRVNRITNDDFFNFDGDGESKGNVGFAGHDEGKNNCKPLTRELSNWPLKGDEGGQEDADFVEKFQLGREDKKENQADEAECAVTPQEEKMEPTEDAEMIFKKMKQTGLIPNAVTMLDGLCKDGLFQEAMKLFEVMREKATMPEVVLYTAVVEGFCQAQKLDDAKRVFRKMQSNGIAPNAFSYSVLIKGLCRGKRLEDAVKFCVEMLEAGHLPNVATFTTLVLEFCQEKGVEEAQNMIGMLKQKGFCLDDTAFRNYLDKIGPTSPLVPEAFFGPKKAAQ